MTKLVTRCPACEGDLTSTRLSCTNCDVQLDGQFEIPPLLRLGREDLAFIVNFVKTSGSLKEMAKIEGQSYPTIRGRLNDLITRLRQLDSGKILAQHEILDAVAAGTMTAAQGAALLKEASK